MKERNERLKTKIVKKKNKTIKSWEDTNEMKWNINKSYVKNVRSL